MPEEIVYYVTNYGYFAIFLLVFFQEIGMPNPDFEMSYCLCFRDIYHSGDCFSLLMC